MTRTTSNHTGMSLVEATIILMVMSLLTSTMAPSIADYVNDAKHVKVKEDCEAIGVTVARVTRDVGRCLKFTATDGCTKTNRVDLLFSDGPDVVAEDLIAAATDFTNDEVQGSLNWDRDDSRGDSMQHQFVTNGPGYGTPSSLGTHTLPGPQFHLGWRGGYMADPLGADPWGKRYLVNATFLMIGGSRDTLCISAGLNGQFETAYGGNDDGGTARGGDDFIYIISGDQR